MNPGIYKKDPEYGDFMTVFPDNQGWNWGKFHNGHEDRSCADGWKFLNSKGDWPVRLGVHDTHIDSYISPFELVRW